MDTTKQCFFEDQPRHFRVVLLVDVSDSGKHAMGFRTEPNVRAFEVFTQTAARLRSGLAGASNMSGRSCSRVNAPLVCSSISLARSAVIVRFPFSRLRRVTSAMPRRFAKSSREMPCFVR